MLPQGGQPVLQRGEGIRLQAVIGPAAAVSVSQQPAIPQHAQVKRQARLGDSQIRGEITDATFALGQGVDHVKTSGVCKSLQGLPGLLCGEGVLHHLSGFP